MAESSTDIETVAMQLAAIMKQLEMLDEVKVKLNDLDIQQKANHMAIGWLEASKCTTSGEWPDDGILPNPTKPSWLTGEITASGRHGSGDGRGAPRYHRLEFPIFDGKEDPLSWINRCKQFFRGQRTMEEEKVWLAAYHMMGTTQLWYNTIEREIGTVPWRCFNEMVHLRFGLPLRHNPLGNWLVSS